MNNEQVMRLMADIGLHEGGMDNWVLDNAWVKFANLVEAQEREACCVIVYEQCESDNVAQRTVNAIRARGTT